MAYKLKKIARDNFSWGVWDTEKKEFVQLYEGKQQAKDAVGALTKADKLRKERAK